MVLTLGLQMPLQSKEPFGRYITVAETATCIQENEKGAVTLPN